MERAATVLIADSTEEFTNALSAALQRTEGFQVVGTAADGEQAIRLIGERKPDLLVLDEPVSGMDQNGLSLFLQTVSALRATHHLAILMVSHDWQLVRQYADYVVLIKQKVLETGTPAEVFSSPAFAETFQTKESV